MEKINIIFRYAAILTVLNAGSALAEDPIASTITADQRLNCVAFSNSGQFLAAGGDRGEIYIWRTADGILTQTLRGHKGDVFSVAFSSDDLQLFSGGEDSSVIIWDIAAERPRRKLTDHRDQVNHVSVSRSGELLASASHDMSIKIWRTFGGELLKTIKAHSGPVLSVDFSPLSDAVASASSDMTSKIWGVNDGELIQTLQERKLLNLRQAVTYSPSGEFLATSDWRKGVTLWRSQDGGPVRRLRGFRGTPLSLAFSPSGEYLVSGDQASELRLWRVSDGDLVSTFKDHTAAVTDVAVSPSGKYMVSASLDKTVRVRKMPPSTSSPAPIVSGLDKVSMAAASFPPADIDLNIPLGQENPNAVAVVIGVKDYQHDDIPSVDFALNDAEAMKRYLLKTLGYRERNIIYLKNPSKSMLERVFGMKGNYKGELFNYLEPRKSDVFVYYAGHGTPDLASKTAYLGPSDFVQDYVQLTGYSLDLLYENLKFLPAKNITVVIDACFSGRSHNGSLIKDASPIAVQEVNPGAAERISIFTAAAGGQISSWLPEKGHSLFTYYFLRAIQGYANRDSDKTLSLREIQDYMEQNVSRIAQRQYNRRQSPTLRGDDSKILIHYQ